MLSAPVPTVQTGTAQAVLMASVVASETDSVSEYHARRGRDLQIEDAAVPSMMRRLTSANPSNVPLKLRRRMPITGYLGQLT